MLAAVSVGTGLDVSRTCSRFVSVSSSFDGASTGSGSAAAGVSAGTSSVWTDSCPSTTVSVSTVGVGSGVSSSTGASGSTFSGILQAKLASFHPLRHHKNLLLDRSRLLLWLRRRLWLFEYARPGSLSIGNYARDDSFSCLRSRRRATVCGNSPAVCGWLRLVQCSFLLCGAPDAGFLRWN